MYYNSLYQNNNKMSGQLFDVNKQISSGLKIQYANEDPEIFSKTMKLDDEMTTLNQVKDSSESAMKFSSQTDTTIGELTKTIEAFKVKLIQASNAGNSQTTLNSLAQEMSGLRDHMVTLSNTSINGQYLFSGTATSTKPINDDGTYNGNNGDIKAFFGNSVQQKYNITGEDLFFGQESTVKREVTTNISLYNQTKLYPDVMEDPNILRSASKEEYIDENSTIRDLMGDSDNVIDSTNAKHHFYIGGVKHDGDSFKETISMRDDETIDDLLTKIGAAYGNSGVADVVTVSLNNTGQIVVTDNISGSSKLQFNMVGNTNDIIDDPATTDANGALIDLNTLYSDKTNVKEFIKSEYSTMVGTTVLEQNKYDPEVFELKNSFMTKDGNFAIKSTLLTDIFSNDVQSLNLSGNKTDGNPILPTSFNITSTATVGDLMNEISNQYDATGNDLDVSLNNGKLSFSSSTQSLDMKIISYDDADSGGQVVNGMPGMSAISSDNSYFLRDGATLKSNISQIVKETNEFATDTTKLVDVSTLNSLDGESLNFSGVDINGERFNVNFDFDSNGVTFSLLDASGANSFIYPDPFKIYNADGTATVPNELTYKQFTNAINIITTNTIPAVAGTHLHPDTTPYSEAEEYDFAVNLSKSLGQTSLDHEGKINFQDKTSATTKAEISLFDKVNSSDFDFSDPLNPPKGSILSFQSNSALTVSDPKNNFFAALDQIIKSVEDGKYDANGLSSDPRNIGMQNSIQLIDDVADHISREQTQSGVQSQVLESTRNRSELLIVNTQMLRSDVVDTDLAEASLKLNQLSLNYQAMLSTVGKVTKLSLVNYL
jgi:flagellar hook-associated protein 3 FlgL